MMTLQTVLLARLRTSQLIKVTSDANGNAVGFVTIQGKNYQAGTTGADVLVNSAAAAPTTGVATGTLLSDATATAQLQGTSTQNHWLCWTKLSLLLINSVLLWVRYRTV
jgi:hypothetical protein